jgi:membrane protease YdiL (CAAX protease family)
MTDRQQPTQRPHGWVFIELAALGVNTAHSYAVAAAIVIACPFVAAIALGLAAGVSAAVRHNPPGSTTPAAALLEQYLPIIVAGAAVLYATARLHRRPWQSLVAPDLRLDWRRLAIGGGAELAILGGQLGLVVALVDWPWGWPGAAALAMLAVGLVLVPLQAASEEVLFRGYLTQALGRVVRRRAVIVLVVGVVFGALHLNAYGSLTVPYFVVVSLVFSLVSLRDDRLELAIGGHAAMNLFAFAAAGTMVAEPALIGAGSSAIPFNWAAILVLAVNGALFYGLTRLLVRLFCEPPG